MLGEKDLIFLGACILLSNGRTPFFDETEQVYAIETSKKLFDEIFNDDNKEKMIME